MFGGWQPFTRAANQGHFFGRQFRFVCDHQYVALYFH
jgi:hypothetical protein